MHIVVVGTSPEWQEVVKAPWELVSAVRIDGLEEAQDDPDVHGQDVEVPGECAPEDRAADSSEPEDHDFDRGGVFSSHSEGSRVLVMDFVDAFVERRPVECAMGEVVPGVFHDEEDGDLVGHGPQGGERNGSLEAAELGHGMEEPIDSVSRWVQRVSWFLKRYRPDLREFDCKVTKKD